MNLKMVFSISRTPTRDRSRDVIHFFYGPQCVVANEMRLSPAISPVKRSKPAEKTTPGCKLCPSGIFTWFCSRGKGFHHFRGVFPPYPCHALSRPWLCTQIKALVMLQQDDTPPARHIRLFELIRQKNQAETVVARIGNFDIRRISANEMIQLQKAAERSLQAQS